MNFEVQLGRDWCERHAAPLWNAVVGDPISRPALITAHMGLFVAFFDRADVQLYCALGDVPDDDDAVPWLYAQPHGEDRMTLAIIELGPMCDLVDAATLNEITNDALAGRIWRGVPPSMGSVVL